MAPTDDQLREILGGDMPSATLERLRALCGLPSSHCSPSGVEADVCADITARQQRGIAKYGVTVAENPLPLREWLQHAYEETLDKAIYIKRAIAEMENSQDRRPEGSGVSTCSETNNYQGKEL